MASLLLAVADTVLVRQVTPDRTGFEQTVFVAAGLAQIVTLVVLVLLAVIFFRMWRAQQAIQTQLGELGAKLDPMIASATSAAENVRQLTDAVRTDAVAAAEALSEATGRVRDSVGGIADRIDEFGDLMGRVTQKAEAVADVAEAAVTTFRAGRRLFRERGGPRSRDARGIDDRRAERAAYDEALDEPHRLTRADDGPAAARPAQGRTGSGGARRPRKPRRSVDGRAEGPADPRGPAPDA